jgi:hypothetical protein
MQEIVVEVSKEEYQVDLASGLQEDEVLKPGCHLFKRGGFLTRHGLQSEQTNSVNGQALGPCRYSSFDNACYSKYTS